MINLTGDSGSKPLKIPAGSHQGYIVAQVTEQPIVEEAPAKNAIEKVESLALGFLHFTFILLFLACVSDYMQW